MLATLCCREHRMDVLESLMLILGAQLECLHTRVSDSTFFLKKGRAFECVSKAEDVVQAVVRVYLVDRPSALISTLTRLCFI